MFLAVALSGIVCKFVADRFAEHVAIRELERRGAASVWMMRPNGAWAHWIFIMDDWRGTDSDLRSLRALGRTVTNVALQNKAVSDSALGHLSRLKHLTVLSIVDCSITDSGLQNLPDLPSLATLRVFGVPISMATVELLQTRHTRLTVLTERRDMRTTDEQTESISCGPAHRLAKTAMEPGTATETDHQNDYPAVSTIE